MNHLFSTLVILPVLGLLLSCSGVSVQQPAETERPFTLDCHNTTDAPCRTIVASHQGNPVQLEPSSVVWSEQFNRAFIVSDNFNDLSPRGTGHFVISYFSYTEEERELTAFPLLSRKQAEEFKLYDLEGIALQGSRLYAIGSLALHGKNPDRDRWERYQFVQMDLKENNGRIIAENLRHVSARWPNFRDWVVTRSGHQWSSKELLGRAEGEGINVEALTATSRGTLIVGFRGPVAKKGGALAFEIFLPEDEAKEPSLSKTHEVAPLKSGGKLAAGSGNEISAGKAVAYGAMTMVDPLFAISTFAAVEHPDVLGSAIDLQRFAGVKTLTLRGMAEMPGNPRYYYLILGPKGYEKELLFLVVWDAEDNHLEKVIELPKGFVAEGVTPIAPGKLLIVDDLSAMAMLATETGKAKETQ